MKLRDVVGKIKNSNNQQTSWNPKKRILKSLDISEEDLLDMDISKIKRRCFE